MDKELLQRILDQYNSAETTAHHGGVDGRPFWNGCASQFMYVPAFDFAPLPGYSRYMFTATDNSGKEYSFEASSPKSLLTPIWSQIPTGEVVLKVEALDANSNVRAIVGMRTFYKSAPFRGSYREKKRSYAEAARFAYDYGFNLSFIQYWLNHNSPDPEYDLNNYPSKIYSAVINGMVNYAKLSPENAEDAIKIAKNAADFMISISFPEGSPLEFIPPTYYNKHRPNGTESADDTARERIGIIMTDMAADSGKAYLNLEKATGDVKYLEAAKRIAEYYKKTVLPCGSWYIRIFVETGEPATNNITVPEHILTFMLKMYERTGDESYKAIADGCVKYFIDKLVSTYNWEGQFEDSILSYNYSNLSHYGATCMASYFADQCADDEACMAEAADLIRFVEDQFVVWEKPAEWDCRNFDTSIYFLPAVFEQYNWYVPVDASMANVMITFAKMYKATGDEIYREKACAMGDMLTYMQNEETGMIPTQWHIATCREDGGGFWINCMFSTANHLFELSKIVEE